MPWSDLGTRASGTDYTNLQFWFQCDVTIPLDPWLAFLITVAVVRESCILHRIEWWGYILRSVLLGYDATSWGYWLWTFDDSVLVSSSWVEMSSTLLDSSAIVQEDNGHFNPYRWLVCMLGTNYSVTWCQHPRRTDTLATLLQKPKNSQGYSPSVTGSFQFWLREISIGWGVTH